MRVTGQVERRPVVVTDGRDYERVSVPTAGRVAHPGRIRTLRKRASVGENLPIDGLVLIQNGNQAGRLNNSEGEVADPDAGFRTRRKTIDSVRIVAVILLALFEECGGPGLYLFGLQ